jgi:transcriptional regulator with XRE-family HTH domain
MDLKARRKALGWSRADLAARTGLNSAAIALIEREAWTEEDAITRVHFVLSEAEAGRTEVRLDPPKPGEDDLVGG